MGNVITQETVDFINKQQERGTYKPHSCNGFEGCQRTPEQNKGILIATLEGMVCPCGKYKHSYRESHNSDIDEVTKHQNENPK